MIDVIEIICTIGLVASGVIVLLTVMPYNAGLAFYAICGLVMVWTTVYGIIDYLGGAR